LKLILGSGFEMNGIQNVNGTLIETDIPLNLENEWGIS